MDPRHRADETLARARERGAFIVTPDSATSPMDAATTQRIPRQVADDSGDDDRDPSTTMVISQSSQQPAVWPPNDYGYTRQDLPPNPYQTQRRPNEFGPLGSQHPQPRFPNSSR
jgi:hypothetical protein